MELLHEAFTPVNIGLTIMLILVVIYWVTVILGALDVSFLDVDFHADADFDMDADVDVDGFHVEADMDHDFDHDAHADADAGGFLRALLAFFYIGEVPVMVIVTIMSLSLWAISVMGNYYFNPPRSFLIALPVYAGAIVASSLICKVVARPFRRIFAAMNNDPNLVNDVIGRICTVITTEVTADSLGQAQVEAHGAPIQINVLADSGCRFTAGQEAVIIEKKKDTGIYIISKIDLEK